MHEQSGNGLRQERKVGAEAHWVAVADALREKQPKRGAMMDTSREDVLAYIGLRPFVPQSIHWMDWRLRRTGANSQRRTGRRSRARLRWNG